MFTRSLSAALVFPLLAVGSAFAQWGDVPMAPPMDMSGLMMRQMQLQAWGDQAAFAAGQKYLHDVQEFRRQTGYTGPLPSPVSPGQLQASIQGLQAQYDRNNEAWRRNSDRTMGAIDRYAIEAIRGQGTYYNPSTGQAVLLPWGPNSYLQTPYGQYAPGMNPYGGTGMFVPGYGR